MVNVLSPSRFLAAAAMAGGLFCAFAPAHAMTVQPVVIDLASTGRDSSAAIAVDNSFPTPLPVEVTVQSLTFDNNGVRPTGQDDGQLLVFPPQAVIQPGQRQTFRVQWVGDPAPSTSRHFYVSVAQLPVRLPESESAIQIVYNFQVLVNVAPLQGRPDLSIAGAHIVPKADDHGPRLSIDVRNAGACYGYLSRRSLRLVASDASGAEILRRSLSAQDIQQQVGFGLIGPGQTRTLVLPFDLPDATARVEASLGDAGE